MKRNLSILFLLLSFVASAQYGASYIYEYGGYYGSSGYFSFAKNGSVVFQVKASAGYKKAANNPYFQHQKNRGPLPSGTWYITGIKNYDKAILVLTASDDVANFGNRNGFLIHGKGENKTIEESSKGCIILPPSYRKMLRDAFIQNGKEPIPLLIQAFVSDSGQG